MRNADDKILSREAMVSERARLKADGRSVVFTNGTFDLLHAGHATYLEFARQQGDCLILGLNSDASIQRIKGPKRPIIAEPYRARMVAALECIDYVVVFDEDEPVELIEAVIPDVLVKGKDWAHYVAGREVVEAHGGKIVLADMVEGLSSSNVIEQILIAYREDA